MVGEGTENRSRWAILVGQVDGQGTWRASSFLADGLRASVFQVPAGFLILDDPAPRPVRGIRYTWLDPTLKFIKQEEPTKGSPVRFDTALPAKNGAFHIFGLNVTRPGDVGGTAIGRLEVGNDIAGVHVFPDWNSPSPTAKPIAEGATENEIAVLLSRDEHIKLVIKLVRLKYVE